jgi:hypothetical protein
MDVVKGSTTHTDYSVSADATSGNRTHLVRQFVSPKLDSQTFSGTVKAQIRGLESAALFNGKIAINVYRVNSSGTYQDTLLTITYSDSDTSPYELATSATNRRVYNSSESQPISLTSRTFSAGDYLVVEIGIAENGTTTSRTGTLRFGDNNANDLPDDTSSTNDYCPYVEFSADITFKERLIGTIPCTSTVNGDLTVSSPKLLEGTITCASNTVNAELNVTKNIIGTIDGLSTVNAELNRITPIAGSVYDLTNKNKVTPNQSTGTDTLQTITGFYYTSGTTISSSTDYARSGSRSLKIVGDGNSANQGATCDSSYRPTASGSTNYTFSGYARQSDNWYIGCDEFEADNTTWITAHYQWVGASAGNFNRGSINFTTQSNCGYLAWYLVTEATAPNTWYVDDIQCEAGSLTDWVAAGGGTSPSSVTGDLTIISIKTLEGIISPTSTVNGVLNRLISLNGTTLRNMLSIEDSTFEGGSIGSWLSEQTVVIDTNPYTGNYNIKAECNSAVAYSTATGFYPVIAGNNYVFSAYLKSTATRQCSVWIQWFNSSDGYIDGNWTFFNPTSSYDRYNVTGQAPVGAVKCKVGFNHQSPQVGDILRVDTNQFEIGTTPSNFESPGGSTVIGALNATKTITGLIPIQSNIPNNQLLSSKLITGLITNNSNIPNTELNRTLGLTGLIANTSNLPNILLNYTAGLSGLISNQSNIPNTELTVGTVTYKYLDGTITNVSNIPNNQLLVTKNIIGAITSSLNIPNNNLNYQNAGLFGTITNISNLPNNPILVNKTIAGLISNQSNVPDSNLIYQRAGLIGIINNQSSVVAGLNLNRQIIGAINIQSNIPNSLLDVSGYILLSGNISNTSTLNVNIIMNYALTGVINNQTTIQSNTISLNRLIGGNISSTSSINADYLIIQKRLSGIINAESNTVDAGLLVNKTINGIINNQLIIPNPDLSIISYFTELIGSIESHSLTIADLGNAIQLIGTIQSTSHVYGTLIEYIITRLEEAIGRIDLSINQPFINMSIFDNKINLNNTNPSINITMKNPYIYFEILYENEII